MTRRDAYAAVAGLYDPVTAAFLDPVRRLVRDTLVGLGARRVCDVCCGTGRLVGVLRRSGLEAVGVDASPAMLARASRAGLSLPIPVARQDARRLAFADGTFDAAVTTFALHENGPDDRLAVLGELFRVTRPGGHVLVADYLAGLPPSPMGLLVGLAERLAGAEHSRNYRDFLARKGVVGLFRAAGRPVARLRPCLGGRAALLVSPVPPGSPAAGTAAARP
ncbi:MAG: class I SAM-dependent methyltransferase [Solidesulfovibrio sp. DCME]|uniref:class I SAM-dependent methyltransferase n=1 Tax=Solidesulfovibrio sp. DCME TaxID=3447380 RepID=UPI003D09BDAC